MANAKVQQIPNVIVGSRYIFFKELSFEENPSFRALGKHALNKLNNIDRQLMGIDKEKDEKLNGFTRIETYLHFLDRASKQMQQNEAQFVQQQLQKMKNIKNKFKTDEFKKIEELLNNIINDNIITNYDDFITILNELLLDPKQKENIIKSQYNNILQIEQNFKKMNIDDQEIAEKAYIESYEKYKKDFASKLKQSLNNETIKIPYITSLLADKINSVISKLSNNPQLLNTVKEKLLKKGIKEADLLEVIIGIITETIFDTPEADTETLVNQITEQTNKNVNTLIKQFLDSNSFDTFSKKTQKTLEQLAMRKENQFEDLANAALLIDAAEMEEVFSQYDPDNKYGLRETYNNLQELIQSSDANINMINNRKGQFTHSLGQAIQTNIIETIKLKTGKTDFKSVKEVIKDEANEYYKKRKLKEELGTQLKITRINHNNVAEIAASKEVHNVILDVLFDRVNGKSINLKTDVSFLIGFSPKTGSADLPVKAINNIINKELQDFLPAYHDLAKGATNTETSRQVLIDKMNKIIKKIEKKLKITENNRKEIENMLNELYDAFLGGISVKDYALYNNKLGFHGGSLGASGTPETVINNIIGMYDAGGIDIIDADDILFAILNSTESTYGDDALKTHVANYLLGGAALAMFDEDFLTAQKFLENTESTLFSENHIRSVQLYKLNSIYVPASYILSTIYKQLVPIYEDIVVNFNNFPQTNNVQITTHNLTPADIPNSEEYPKSIDRWNKISELGVKNTKIQFMFMAGMLDTFKNLGKAFNIPL